MCLAERKLGTLQCVIHRKKAISGLCYGCSHTAHSWLDLVDQRILGRRPTWPVCRKSRTSERRTNREINYVEKYLEPNGCTVDCWLLATAQHRQCRICVDLPSFPLVEVNKLAFFTRSCRTRSEESTIQRQRLVGYLGVHVHHTQHYFPRCHVRILT